MLPRLVIGPVGSLAEAQYALRSIQEFADALAEVLSPLFEPTADGTFKVVVSQDDGKLHLWTLVAGSGTTVSFDSATSTVTVSAP